ncbi:MAG: DNA mismatch repair protein MutS [Veillonellaceae bacterium]|nr:DNA mismatch repair protein MutS [Veillonellaceae bacterium]
MAVSYTPMMQQYREIKSKHTNEILFFRLGDFYEMFFEDAQLASKELEITLTSRDGGQNARVPMCGVPYHAADNYIAKLISKGYKVAICEQVEDPKSVKGLVRREVVKIITPGTVLSETLLVKQSNNYLAIVLQNEEAFSLAASDISTGECLWADFTGSNRFNDLCDQLFRLMPSELVLIDDLSSKELKGFLQNRLHNCICTVLEDIDTVQVDRLPAAHFKQEELPESVGAFTAVGYLLYYLHNTLKTDLSHINSLQKYNVTDHLIIDSTTLRNLEITNNMRDGGKTGTLFHVIDFTKTAMGTRLLKRWLEFPLLDINKITTRQDAVEELCIRPAMRQKIQDQLANIYDFERILTRIEVGLANARDLNALKISLTTLPDIKSALYDAKSSLLQDIDTMIAVQTDMVEIIETAIIDNPPISVREGGIIKAGYNKELDELHELAYNSKKWIQDLETHEREITGIRSLKVGYNKVFGYYIEVTHTHSAAVPANYVRKQTLANAERYITPELKEFENKILGAQEKIINLEYHLFLEIRDIIKIRVQELQSIAKQIAKLDVVVSLSEAAIRYNYIRPLITSERRILIRDGRHPVVERLLVNDMFVPNDVELNHSDCEIMVITGPNMAGKSTYMRQTALLTLMAQIGSFIPAREAAIGPVDRIFTRVGASDDLATGQSTFMVEMNEVAQILKNATSNSLIVLDEIGRGTSTFDGMSIARAVIEYIKQRIKAKTLFATHYHELTELASLYSGVANYSVAVKERGNEVVFLRRIVPGGADKSYGIYVAQLAGLPKKVIERAKKLLDEHESCPQRQVVAPEEAAMISQPMSLFGSSLAEELTKIDLMTITPLEALNILYQLQIQAKQEVGKI